MTKQDDKEEGARERATSYLDYIKNRRQKLTDTVSGAMTRLGMIDKSSVAPLPTPASDIRSGDVSSMKEATKLQRLQLSRGGSNVITLYGKVIPAVNPGGGAARIQKQMREQPACEATSDGFRVHYPDGSNREFQYDQNKQTIIAFKDKDESLWKQHETGLWTRYSAEGKPTGKIWRGSVNVASSGECELRNTDDGQKITERPDGSRTVEESIGAAIEINARGHITTITYVDKQMRRFEHDSEGQLCLIVEKDGSVLKKSADGQWNIFEADGSATGQKRIGNFTLDEQGILVFVDGETNSKCTETADGIVVRELGEGYVVTQQPDGSRMVLCPDDTRMRILGDGTIITETETGFLTQKTNGVYLEADRAERLIRVQRVDGLARDLFYDSADRLYEISDYDDSLWHRLPGEFWVQFATGRETGLRYKGAIEIDVEGTLSFRDRQENVVIFQHVDGTAFLMQPDGTRQSLAHVLDLASLKQWLVLPSDPSWKSGVSGSVGSNVPDGSNFADRPDGPADLDNSMSAMFRYCNAASGEVKLRCDGAGRVSRIEYTDNFFREIDYSADGTAIALCDQTGRQARRNTDGTWTTYSTSGDSMGVTESAELLVTLAGVVIWRYKCSGAQTILCPDQSAARFDMRGNLQEYLSPSQRRFVFGATYDVRPGDTLQRIAEDVVCFQRSWQSDAPGESSSELAAAIARINHLAQESELMIGRKLVLPRC